jgi:hypothetical protein
MTQIPPMKELRNFGLLVGGVFSVIGLWPWLVYGYEVRLWAFTTGALLMACGGLAPSSLTYVYHAWMWVGHILGWINTRILLGLVFYGLITPIAIVFRMLGKDTMRQAFSAASSSYRVNRQPRAHTHMKNQF